MQSPNPNTTLRQRTAQAAALLSSLLAVGSLPAQEAPAKPEGVPDEVVELSVFAVNTEKDYGYRASNSIAGTRSNTPIKDIPVNIQVFTKDLADDLIITNQVDFERYNASLVNGGRDPRSEIPIQQAYNQFLFRGFQQNWGLRDGIREYDPVDTAGLARVEVVKGPVGALYGLSYPGGVMNNVTKDVDFNRNFATGMFTIYDQGGHRASIDANFHGNVQTGQFGVRYNGVNMTDKDDREHSEGNVRYNQVVLAYAPFKNTVAKFIAEKGYREKPNGLSYFATGEVDANGNSLDNGSSVPLQEYFKNITYDWNWSTGTNMRSLETKLYRGTFTHSVGDSLSLTGYLQFSEREQIDGNGWDANGSGGADSWEAGGGWIVGADKLPGTADDRIQMGYSYRDWSNTMHSYGATGVYKLDVAQVKNTFTFGFNVWSERFVSRSKKATDLLTFPVQSGISINVPFGPPKSLVPVTDGNGYTHENNSNDFYYAAWQTSMFDNRLKTNLAINRTNLKLVQWANGDATVPNQTEQSKTSPMAGVVFDVTKQISVFAVHGTSLFPTTEKNSFGTQMPPTTGKSFEGGVKIDLVNNLLSGTISYYNIEQKGGQQTDPTAENLDTQRWDRMTTAERAVAFPGQTRNDLLGDIVPGAKRESKGYEVDLIYQPIKTWQILFSYAHNSNEVTEAINTATIGQSTPGSVEDQFSILSRYEFADGPAKGAFVGAGFAYSSKALQDYSGANSAARYYPSTKNLDLFAGYKFKMAGYNTRLQLNVKNVLRQDEYFGWRATGSTSIRATTPYRIDTSIRYSLTLGIDL